MIKHAMAPPARGGGPDVDVRIRLLIALVTPVAALVLSHPLPLGILCVAGAVYLGLLRRFRLQALCYAALLAAGGMSLVFVRILSGIVPAMSGSGFTQMATPLLRMAALIHPVLALALTMRLRDVLNIMKSLRLPRALYLPLAVTLRFILGLVDDARQVRDCVRLRGYHGLRALNPRLWLLPAVFRCLHLSDELATAAELKGVGYGRPVRAESRPLGLSSSAFPMAISIAVLAAALWVDRALPAPEPVGHGAARQRQEALAQDGAREEPADEEGMHDRTR